MFCSKCGSNQEEGVSFCSVCGNIMQAQGTPQMAAPQGMPQMTAPQMVPQTVVPQQGGMAPGISQGQFNQYNQQAMYNQQMSQPLAMGAALPAKKSKKGLIIGLSIGAAVIIFLIIAFATGLFGNNGLKGKWYPVDSYYYDDEYIVIDGSTIKFYEDDELEEVYQYKVSGDRMTVYSDYDGPMDITYKISDGYLYLYSGYMTEVYSREPMSSYDYDFDFDDMGFYDYFEY